MINAYLSTSDVEELYRKIKRSEKGMTSFIRDAKKVGTKMKKGPAVYYLYKNEEALFEVLKKHLPNELKALGIDCFGRLMQYVS